MRKLQRSTVALLLGLVGLWSSTGFAVEERKLTREETIIEIDMPGLKGAREAHDRGFTSQYSELIHRAEQWNGSSPSSLPRALVRVGDIQRGWKFRPPEALNEQWIKNRSSFFRKPENDVKIVSSRQSTDAQVREARFTAGTAHCYALSTHGDGPTIGQDIQVGRRNISVIYCGAPNEPLSDATIEAIKKGYRLKG